MNWTAKENDPTHSWTTKLEDDQVLEWTGLGVGPLTLSHNQRIELCQQLLGMDEKLLTQTATHALKPFRGTIERSLILHSTTTDLGAFYGDFTKLKAGLKPKNYAGYVETRAPFLGKKGDLAVGRMEGWKVTVAKLGLTQLEVPNLSHYYLSDA